MLANKATAAGVERGERFVVEAPLLDLSKAQIVQRAADLGVDLGLTHTCYDPVLQDAGPTLACGACDACILRLKGFRDAAQTDPISYVRATP